MASGNGASSPVRPTAGSNGQVAHQSERVEAGSADFELALDQALAPLDSIITGPRRRAEALCRARREILAAAAAAMKAERRRVVAARQMRDRRVFQYLGWNCRMASPTDVMNRAKE
jgi:hypothetical protein